MTKLEAKDIMDQRQRKLLSNGNMELLLSFIGLAMLSLATLLSSIFDLLPAMQGGGIHSTMIRSLRTAESNSDSMKRSEADSLMFKGKERFVNILREMDIDPHEYDADTWDQLPTWDLVEELYGDGPIVHGLDTCQAFREQIPAIEMRVAAAGIFNTGTNANAILLQHNCQIPERVKKMGPRKGHGMEWQVPWGKHTPAQFRLTHTLRPGKPGTDAEVEQILPVVSIRDPYDWMQSMCRNPYTARWYHHKRCPNLVRDDKSPVGLLLRRVAGGKELPYESLAHLWNGWNNEYYKDATYPRLFVRFEDLIFYPRETTELVCSCVGGEVVANDFGKVSPGKFQYLVNSAKKGPAHGKVKDRTTLMTAWIKYGKRKDWSLFHKDDLEYARKVLDEDMMKRFRYRHPPINLS